MKHWCKPLMVLALLAAQAMQCVRADDYRTTLFDDKGRPTDAARRYFDYAPSGLKIVHGIDIPVASQDKKGEWSLLEEPACITVSFRVSPAGAVDKFVVLDSQPKDLLVPAVTQAISQWKFEKIAVPAWIVFPFAFGFEKSRSLIAAPRFQGKQPEADQEKVPHCVVPKRDIQTTFSAGVEFAAEADPVYPSPELFSAHPSGCATVAFRVAADGTPVDPELLDAKPDQSFVDIAALTVESWRFKPFTAGPGEKPRFGFARFGYADEKQGSSIPECMTADFAAQHYQSSEHPQ